MISISEAFQTIYKYLVYASGAAALISFIAGGIIFLSSAGNPEKLNKAKKQIFAALLGTIILFSSYIILKTINPDLTEIQMPQLKSIIISPVDLPPAKTRLPDLFEKIKDIVDNARLSSQKITEAGENIQNSAGKCDCGRTSPLCICSGGSESSSCEPEGCYSDPCPSREKSKLKENQKNIIAWKDEILYYKNRAEAETEDLKEEIKKVLDEKILYYIKTIMAEENEEIKKYFEEKKEKISKEKNFKKDLISKLEELSALIQEIAEPSQKVGQLPDECLANVKDKCQASCQGECHDTQPKQGCQPQKCSGGNPCPMNEIGSRLKEIRGKISPINKTCDEILIIIEEIKKLKIIIQ